MNPPRASSRKPESRPREIVAIHKALRGPVVEVLANSVPALAKMPRDQVYDAIMDNPKLADACFKLFRGDRARFNTVVKRADGKAVADDTETLDCGRSLADAITLIVRAVARRYFSTFEPSDGTSDAPVQPRPSAWARTMRAIEWVAAPGAEPDDKPKPPRTEELYQAFRNFLLFEWQVALVPQYAHLPVAVVRAVGPLLLQLREPAQVEALGQIRVGKVPAPPDKHGPPRFDDLEEPSFQPAPRVKLR